MVSPLSEKVAIITGASKGIGAAIAGSLAGEGIHLMLNARSEAGLAEIRARLLQANPEAAIEVFAGSVSEARVVEQLVDATVKAYGRLDILVNNAGVSPEFRLLQELSIEDIEQTIDINLKGPIYGMKYAIPQMVHQGGGFIINLNSTAGKTAFPYSSVYCASKFGLAAVTESVAGEQRLNNIKIVGIFPGEVHTPIWDSIEPHIVQNPDLMLDPDDIAKAVLYILQQSPKTFIKEIYLVPTFPPNH